MKDVAAVDLTALEQDDLAVVEIQHPSTGDPTGITVEVYGQDSDIYRAETRKAEARYAEYARRNRGKMMPPEDRERMDRAKVIACTKSITPVKSKGETLTDAEAIFNRFPWIYEQTVQGILDRGNFIKGSSPK